LLFSVSGYTYLDDGGTDRREILHDGTHWVPDKFSLLLGVVPSGDPPNPKLWAYVLTI